MSSYDIVKRFFSFITAFIGLIFLMPIIFLISLAIKLDSSGPIIFKQQRVGKNGNLFDIYKFRTMTVYKPIQSEHEYVAKLLAEPETKARDWYLQNDARVTRVGGFLRKYALNELPSLFNVLKGDMNIVGPRPVLPFEAERFSEEMSIILTTVPGIIGLSVDEATTYDEMIKKDLEYVRHQSFALDLKIILRTIPNAFRGSY
jgi:lipopolysaccharide/colanic/teichoic acid biosynthesis glycosyltransferase